MHNVPVSTVPRLRPRRIITRHRSSSAPEESDDTLDMTAPRALNDPGALEFARLSIIIRGAL